tara:strand:+ start:4500 stop:4934 length:435 start_codon:yes stop_codon:yes gene_type:complete
MIDTFWSDLKRGKQVERMALDLIHTKYPSAYIIDGYNKFWDIYVPELEVGIEVKSDEKSKYTGNIVVEIAFNGRKSALCVTKAKYWMFYDGYGFVAIKPDRIWDCINDNKLVPVNFIGKGDTKQKTAYLIKKSILYQYKEYGES